MQPTVVINEKVAQKVLEVVDCGLTSGLGTPKPGHMCVEAAVCYALELPHGDDPSCVSSALRSLKIRLNDSRWSSDKTRASGLRKLALCQLGSEGFLDDAKFTEKVALMTVRQLLPRILRRAGFFEQAKTCEEAGNLKEARAAAAYATAAAAYATAAATAAAAAYATAAAADAAAAYATAAAAAAAYVAAADADAAADAAAAAAYATAAAADAAAAYATAADAELSFFADQVVQILIEMNAPGCQWLYLCDKE